MKHMIRWLKICALLLAIILVVHSLEIVYDILYHHQAGTLLKPH